MKAAPAPAPAPAPKPAPKPVAKKVVAPAPAPVAKKEDAPILQGVALGAAPLIDVPVLALGAGRNILSATKARREKIQAEIEEYERKEKAKVDAEVDAGGIFGALVNIGIATGALGLVLSGATSGFGGPSMPTPSISIPAPTKSAPAASTAPPSAVKKVEKKAVKKIKTKSGYDLSLEAEVKKAKAEAKAAAKVSFAQSSMGHSCAMIFAHCSELV